MKLFLIASLLLLVPLAFVEPVTPPELKMLFADDIVLTESFDERRIRYYGYKNVFHLFTTSDVALGITELGFKEDLARKSTGFTVEINEWKPNLDDGVDPDLCKHQSDEKLKNMIVHCFGNVTLRMLTNEERSQIIEYRNKQQASKKPFEVIYDHKRTITKSRDLDDFLYTDSKVGNDLHALGVNAKVNPDEAFDEMHISDRLVDRSFVIEGLPAESKEHCGKEGLEDLYMVSCKGRIKLRPI